MSSSLSLQISKPPYSALLREVEAAQDQNWFERTGLRAKVYAYVLADQEKWLNWRRDQALDEALKTTPSMIWKVCSYTAPLALTQIAPESSYREKEEAFFRVAIYQKPLELPSVQIGPQFLQKALQTPLNQEDGLEILCSLSVDIRHVFVIEKRGDQCFLYQSYISSKASNVYIFDHFLKDESKHTSWNPEDLVLRIGKVIDRSLPSEERIQAYSEVFFCCPLVAADLEKK